MNYNTLALNPTTAFDNSYIESQVILRRNIKNMQFPKMIKGDVDVFINSLIDLFYSFSELDIEPTDYKKADNSYKLMLDDDLLVKELRNLIHGRYALLLGKKNDDDFCVLLNVIDHICMKQVSHGLDVKNLYNSINKLDDKINKQIDYAYDTKYGYLTSSINELGTGLRAGVTMYLPALQSLMKLDDINYDCKYNYDCIIRPIYSFGLKNSLSMYEVHNVSTLGIDEDKIIENVKDAAEMINETEMYERDNYYASYSNDIVQEARVSLDYLNRVEHIEYEDSIDHIASLRKAWLFKRLNSSNDKTGDMLKIVKNSDFSRFSSINKITQEELNFNKKNMANELRYLAQNLHID